MDFGFSIPDDSVTDSKLAEDVNRNENLVRLICTANISVVQGTWVDSPQTSQIFNYILNNNASIAQNDEVRFKHNVKAGRYTIHFRTWKGSASGICHLLDTDDTSLGTMDMFDNSGVYGWQTIADVDLTAGEHNFGLKIATKNASASAYNIALSGIVFERTGDCP